MYFLDVGMRDFKVVSPVKPGQWDEQESHKDVVHPLSLNALYIWLQARFWQLLPTEVLERFTICRQ